MPGAAGPSFWTLGIAGKHHGFFLLCGRQPPVGIPRDGAQTDWPEVVGKNLQRDGRKEGGGRRRRKGGRNREEGGRRFEGRNRDFPVVLGVQGGSLGALERCLGGLRWTSGVPGVLLGDPWGLFGSSWALPRGSWDVFWGSVVRVEPKRTILRTSSWGSWQFFWEPFLCTRAGVFQTKRKQGTKSRKSVNKL